MIIAMLFILGLVFGSFVYAYVWRTHLSQVKKHTKISVFKGRSICDHCGHTLAAKDLIPVLSWFFTKGRCRYCKKSVSWVYPAVELSTGVLFVVSYLFWPGDFSETSQNLLFGLWLIITLLGLALAVYDLKWMILPNKMVYQLAAASAVFVLVLSTQESDRSSFVAAIVGSLLFGGLFYAMYQVSKGRWIGGGDVRLGFVLGLLLGWQKSLLGLTFAAYIGTALIVLLLIFGKYHAKMKIPFGPLLLGGSFIAFIWGQPLIDWYLRLSGL